MDEQNLVYFVTVAISSFAGTLCFWSCASEKEQKIRRDLFPFLSFNYKDHPSSSRLISLFSTPQSQAVTLLDCRGDG